MTQKLLKQAERLLGGSDSHSISYEEGIPRFFKEEAQKKKPEKKKNWKAYFHQKQEEALNQYLLPKPKNAAQWKKRKSRPGKPVLQRPSYFNFQNQYDSLAKEVQKEQRIKTVNSLRKERRLKPHMLKKVLQVVKK